MNRFFPLFLFVGGLLFSCVDTSRPDTEVDSMELASSTGVCVPKKRTSDSIQECLDEVSLGGVVQLEPGTYNVTDTVVVRGWNVSFLGQSSQLTVQTPGIVGLRFDSTVLTNVQDITVYTSKENVTGVELNNVVQFRAGRLSILDSNVGLSLGGRDSITFETLYIRANSPIVINPLDGSAVDLDHTNFMDTYLNEVGKDDPVIFVQHDVILQEIKFSGYQAWVGGTHGFMWTSGNPAWSTTLRFESVRHEQAGPGAWSWLIAARLQHFVCDSCRAARQVSGWSLHDVSFVTIRDSTYDGDPGGTTYSFSGTDTVVLSNNITFERP